MSLLFALNQSFFKAKWSYWRRTSSFIFSIFWTLLNWAGFFFQHERNDSYLQFPSWYQFHVCNVVEFNITCTSANVIYCIACTYCNKLYIGETGRPLVDRFREHLREVERNDKDTSKPVARHFNLPNHSKQHIAVSGLSLHLGSSESRKTLEQKFIFQIGTLNPYGINERFSSNQFFRKIPTA